MNSRQCLRYLFLCCLVLPGTALADKSYERIIGFGDSLSDPGNAFILLQQSPGPAVALPPFDVIPSAPYESRRFSNGDTWVEQLSHELGLDPSAGPAFDPTASTPRMFSNFAVGGARARDFGEAPTLSQQVGLFLQRAGGAANPDALYAITIGGNDLRDVTLQPADGANIIRAAVRAIHDNLELLVLLGARDFLVADLPNLAVVPAITLQDDPRARFEALLASLMFNAALRTELERIDALPGVRLRIIEAFRLSTEVAIGRSPHLDFDAGTVPCLTFFEPILADAICDDPDEHFYWDGIHPTEAGHAVIAQRGLAKLGEHYYEAGLTLHDE